MKVRIYADTSVFSAYYDERAPDRKALTQEFWNGIEAYGCSTSDLAVAEIEQTKDEDLRSRLKALVAKFQLHPLTPEMRELAVDYIRAGAFSTLLINDALHVAAATLTRQDILISWNFKHLVNRRRRAIINSVNTMKRLPTLDILSPPEV
jgi:predicted nucleic acid-binding protein